MRLEPEGGRGQILEGFGGVLKECRLYPGSDFKQQLTS